VTDVTQTTATTAPDWLSKRGGAIKRDVRPETRFVLVGGEPLYKLEVRPAAGRFACAVSNSNNGARLDDGAAIYANPEEALAGGLEQLRRSLGW
jgi:hypothetical protein